MSPLYAWDYLVVLATSPIILAVFGLGLALGVVAGYALGRTAIRRSRELPLTPLEVAGPPPAASVHWRRRRGRLLLVAVDACYGAGALNALAAGVAWRFREGHWPVNAGVAILAAAAATYALELRRRLMVVEEVNASS